MGVTVIGFQSHRPRKRNSSLGIVASTYKGATEIVMSVKARRLLPDCLAQLRLCFGIRTRIQQRRSKLDACYPVLWRMLDRMAE